MTPPLSKTPPNAADRILFLDDIRAVAILLVVGFHLLIESYGGLHAMESRLSFTDGNWHHALLAALPFSYGALGVAVFFFVSGFCIHLSHRRSAETGYKFFFLRRFFRLYPAYFLALCFFAFVFPMTAIQLNSPINIAQFFSHVLMVHNLDPRSFYGINGTFWTLGVEVQLYLIYPLLLLLARRLGWNGALLVAGGIELGLRVYGSLAPAPHWIYAAPFSYWFSWAIGARIADDYLSGRPLLLARCPVLLPLGLAVFFHTVKPLFFLVFPCVALTTAALAAHLASRSAAAREPGLLARAFAGTGVISYSLYLLHGPLLAWAANHLRAAFPGFATPWTVSLCLLAFCVPLFGVSWLFYRWMELPGIALGKRVMARMRTASAPAGKVPAA